jgi:hypothetical protein
VALSAFASFCRGARESRFPRLADRQNLWGLLLTARPLRSAVLPDGKPPFGEIRGWVTVRGAFSCAMFDIRLLTNWPGQRSVDWHRNLNSE